MENLLSSAFVTNTSLPKLVYARYTNSLLYRCFATEFSQRVCSRFAMLSCSNLYSPWCGAPTEGETKERRKKTAKGTDPVSVREPTPSCPPFFFRLSIYYCRFVWSISTNSVHFQFFVHVSQTVQSVGLRWGRQTVSRFFLRLLTIASQDYSTFYFLRK